jgi:hypothetical protein
MKKILLISKLKKHIPMLILAFLGVNTVFVFQQCGKKNVVPISYVEERVLVEPVFTPEETMSGVVTELNNAEPLNPYVPPTSASSSQVKSCDLRQYEEERQAALIEAEADLEKKTIPVEFSISIGTTFDDTAYLAFKRSILRVDDDGITPVYVAPANNLSRYQSNAFHYVADHREARQEYISGKKCFFSTIKVVTEKNGPVLDTNGKYNHDLAILYYGDLYDRVTANSGLSPRLFSKLDSGKPLQFIPLYVADFREQRFPGLFSNTFPLINRKFSSSGIRRREYQLTTSDIFELRNLFLKRKQAQRVLSQPSQIGKYVFSAYEGAGQLLKNMIFTGFPSVLMSVQYTPLILDLGERGIRTSSSREGTFFNLANLERLDTLDSNKKFKIHHLTSWVGGLLKNINLSCENCEPEWRRIAQDGILVYSPGTNTKHYTGRDLLGSSFVYSQSTFGDGFRALRVLGDKDCKSIRVKERYIGPWDGNLYSDRLKVWIDQNRDGNNDQGETITLAEAGVLALNTCNIIHKDESDQFGNSTALRAAFLYAPGENLPENRILERLSSGKDKLGATVEFRAAIDIFFRPIVNLYLEDVDPRFVKVPFEENQLSLSEHFKGKKKKVKFIAEPSLDPAGRLVLGNQDGNCVINFYNPQANLLNEQTELSFEEDSVIALNEANSNLLEKENLFESSGSLYSNQKKIASVKCSETISHYEPPKFSTSGFANINEAETSAEEFSGNIPAVKARGMRWGSACRILGRILEIPECEKM